MKAHSPHRSPVPATKRRAPTFSLLLFAATIAAQDPLDIKPPPTPDPVKGWHDMSPMPAAELAMRRAGRPRAPHMVLPMPAERGPITAGARDAVLFDQPGDGRIWAIGTTWKASFGTEGFVYVPFLGSDAPRNYPVHFVLRAVRVGGQSLSLAAGAPTHAGARITYERGAVREVYDLGLEQVEQTFVVDTALAGDVEVEVEVVSELAEDASTDAVQFTNALGAVHYGQAHVVDGSQLRPVATTFAENTIRIHVPAAGRGAGALVIDPIIHTSAFTATHGNDAGQPDIAYDAAADRYMVVWEHPFSANDIDIWSEFRNADGTAVAGSLATIDYTTLTHSHPRVGNLNSGDIFLVAMQRFEAGIWRIVGRRRASNAAPDAFVFDISSPSLLGHCVLPDVGGDSGNGNHWLVVWERQYSATDFDILASHVRSDTFQAGTIYIENSAATIHSVVSVSQSNGNGFSATPRWLVAYQFRWSPTDEDIYGCAIDANGAITTPNTAIDTSASNDLVPSVSSPNTEFAGGNPLFLVTYERQSPLEARARLLSGGFVNQIAPVNLTGSLGLGPYWLRAECDGNRFAVLNGGSTISVATLAYTGNSLVMHEVPQPLPGIPAYPRLCSKRSGGGLHTDYGIAYVETGLSPDDIHVTEYRGHSPVANFTRRVMGCSGLQIDVAGRAYLSESMTFSLSNIGFDIPGFAYGVPVPATTVLCGACPLGVDANGVILLLGSSLTINVPPNASLVGANAGVQGFAVGSGPCVLTLRFSDTFDLTIG